MTSGWALGYRRARAHSIVVASVLWTTLAVMTFATPGIRNLTNHLKGEDFIQIYTLAHSAFEGP